MDVNHVHNVRFFVQLPTALIQTCLKEAHKASNSSLPLFLWVEEHFSSCFMITYWMLITKFHIYYLIFIRFMREDSSELSVKILISLVKWFFIFNHFNYVRCLTKHIQDLLSLLIICPQIYREFKRGTLQ